MGDDWNRRPYFPPSRPLPADGIKAKSRRGDIGETWWSRRFIDTLESLDLGTRIQRGRHYARRGQVLDLAVKPGRVSARVQGSRLIPYRVRIEVRILWERDWRKVQEKMASQAIFLAKLLSGEMPHDIEEAFAACRLALFPSSRRELRTYCTCPDLANPCKHIAATLYILAERFDEDPFLIFAWRGRDRQRLLEDLRLLRTGRRKDVDQEDDPLGEASQLADHLNDFWRGGQELADLRIDPYATESPEAIVRQLDLAGLKVRGRDLTELLEEAYITIARWAERTATYE